MLLYSSSNSNIHPTYICLKHLILYINCRNINCSFIQFDTQLIVSLKTMHGSQQYIIGHTARKLKVKKEEKTISKLYNLILQC